ncbi:MAG: hypothetical protein ABI624_01505 [Casimicrobiaceae bacterium]
MFGLGKKNAAIEAFAATLVAELTKRFPPGKERELGSDKLKPAQQLGKAVKDLEKKALAFQQEQQLGVYGKAKLLNKIKWQLKELAYSDEFVEVTTTSLAQLLGSRK